MNAIIISKNRCQHMLAGRSIAFTLPQGQYQHSLKSHDPLFL